MNGRLMVILSALGILTTLPAGAEWSIDPMENNIVCEESERQYGTVMTSDGAGGAIIAWTDERGGSRRIYASRLSPEGDLVWSPNAVEVASSVYPQRYPRIVSDGAGGVIVVWQRDDTQVGSIFAQRLAPDGTRLWGSQGFMVSNTWINCQEPEVVGDTFGGAIITWEQGGSSDQWIYAQRIDPSGDPLWDSHGVLVCNETGSRTYLCLAQVGGGGAIIAWRDIRDSEHRIYAQYVTSAGVCAWTADGIEPITTAGSQEDVRIMALGSSAVLAILHDNGTNPPYILCQRLSLGGNRVWGYGARVSYSSAWTQWHAHLCADGESGVFVTWQEYQEVCVSIRAQRLSAEGVPYWTIVGTEVAEVLAGDYPLVFADGHGGALVAWSDGRHAEVALYAQRIDGLGQPRWTGGGIQASRPSVYEFDPAAMIDEDGGIVLAWTDDREGQDTNIYAQRLDSTGYLGEPQPTLTSVVDFPNDQGGEVLVDWEACYLDAWPWTAVECYSIWAREAGRQGWTYVCEIPATLAPEYSCAAFTFGDSTSAGIPLAEYKVIAHSDDPGIFWEAEPMTGYSVDNLAPGAPLDLGAESVGNGDVILTWTASGHHDEDLSHYAVYRGEEAGFPLDAAHFVENALDQTYTDPAGAGLWFYCVTALDVHGNEGDGSNEVEVLVASSDASYAPQPTSVALHARGPMPCAGRTRLAFDLPQECDVDLCICTVDGRRIATLARGDYTAGCHEVDWSPRSHAQGLYFAILRAGDEMRRTRLLFTR